MGHSISNVLISFSGQSVKAHLGLKRFQWSQRAVFRTMARDCLEGMGANVLKVNCFLKTGRDPKPSVDPNVVNVFLKLRDQNRVDIIA